MKRAYITSLFFMFFMVCNACAQTDKIQYASELSRLPVGCRIRALGDAGAALPLDASSAFYNPGAIPFWSHYQVQLEYASLYNGLSDHLFIAMSAPLQNDMTLAALYSGFYSGDIPQYPALPGTPEQRIADPSLRADGSVSGVFENNHNLVLIPVAKRFAIPFSRISGITYPLPMEIGLGFNFKGYWQTFDLNQNVYMGMSINLDLGLLYRCGLDYDLRRRMVSREVCLGVTLRDALPTRVTWINSPENYQEPVDPAELFGISYIDRSGILKADWILTAGLIKSYTLEAQYGIEGDFFNLVAFRAGYNGTTVSLGAGVHYRKFLIDYSFRFDEIDISPLRISAGYQF